MKRNVTTKQITGKGRGKFLGYPTINCEIPSVLDLPYGIYAARVVIDEKSFMGALHFGPVPTFLEHDPRLEVFLLDATEGELPDGLLDRVDIEFVEKIRDIESFHNQKALIAQIKKDVDMSRAILTSTV